MATGKLKVNFKMPTPSAADRMYAKHQIIRKAAGLPDVDNNPDRPNAGKYSSGDSKPVKRVNPVATPSVNEEDITVVKKGSSIKKKISDASYSVFKSHGFVKEGVTIGRLVGRGNVHEYDRNPGPKDGSELENVPFHAKTEKQKKLQNALNDLGNKMKEKYPKLRESKDSQEYDYEGDMAKSDLRSIIHNAKTLHDMLDDNTNLAEWCQSKITLAEDYISTVTNYMRSEMNEEVEQLQEYESKGGSYTHKGSYGSQNTGSDSSKYAKPHTAGGSELKNSTTVGLEKGMGVKWGRKSLGIAQSKQTLMNVHKNLPEEIELDEKKKLPCLWANIHAKRKRGEAPAKPGDKDYPKTLNIEDANPCWTGYKRKPGTKKFEPGSCVKEGVQDDSKADQMTTDDTKFPKKSRKAAIVKSAAKKMPAEDQFQAKPVLDSQVAQQTNK